MFEADLRRFVRVSAGGGVPLEKKDKAGWLKIDPSYREDYNIPE